MGSSVRGFSIIEVVHSQCTLAYRFVKPNSARNYFRIEVVVRDVKSVYAGSPRGTFPGSSLAKVPCLFKRLRLRKDCMTKSSKRSNGRAFANSQEWLFDGQEIHNNISFDL